MLGSPIHRCHLVLPILLTSILFLQLSISPFCLLSLHSYWHRSLIYRFIKFQCIYQNAFKRQKNKWLTIFMTMKFLMKWSSSDDLIKFLVQKNCRLWCNCLPVTRKIDVDVVIWFWKIGMKMYILKLMLLLPRAERNPFRFLNNET